MINKGVLNNLKFSHKLWLLVLAPVLIMVIYAAAFCYERLNELNNANSAYNLTKVTAMLNIVHRLQYERGKAITYVVTQESEPLLDWLAAVKRSDTIIRTLANIKKEFIEKNADQSIVDTLSVIENSIDEIKKLRLQVENEKLIKSSVVENIYTRVIGSIHTNISNLMVSIPGSKTYQLIDSLISIADLKELTGLERGLGSAILKRGSAKKDEIRRLIGLNSKAVIYSEKFMTLAPVKFQEKYLSLGLDNYSDEQKKVFNNIINSTVNKKLIGDSSEWFNITSERINKYRQLEDSISESLISEAEFKKQRANQLLFTTLFITLLMFIILYVVIFLSTRKLTEGFFKLRDSAVKFVSTGELCEVDVSSNDELGEVSLAFNCLIGELKGVSKLLEKISGGDFEQSVIEKGDSDQLSKSLNHMVKTLKISVENLKEQNWLKTGQSELTAQLNSDQSIQAIANRSVNFIASYLNAAVGAIYLVDDEEKSSLFASYAYSNRKDGKNIFEKGESLVGQVVLERKMITIKEIPAGYINITSGLGKAEPDTVIIFPLIYANKVLAVMEIATFENLKDIEFEFIEKISTDLAIVIHGAKNREKMISLLEETQAQSEELKTQQEELESANTELSEQANQLLLSQEELKQQKLELVFSNDELKVNSDALEKKNREVELRSKELAMASKYKSEFLANMSHELRSPLNSLLLLSQTLKENDEQNLSAEQVEALRIIYGSGKDLLSLINDILDLSKVEAGKLIVDKEEHDLHQMLGQIKAQFLPLAKEKMLEFSVEIKPSVNSNVYTDSSRLQQILRNLIGNAIKFTDQGYVRVSVEADEHENMVFKVEDSGVGIPEKLKHAIFEAFQQGDGSTRRKYSGTGLGLTISREMAHLLGGEIVLDSSGSEGAVFQLVIPIGALTAEDNKSIGKVTGSLVSKKALSKDIIESIVPINRGDAHKKNSILIVEDDEAFSGSLKKIAGEMGFESYVAPTLKKANEMLEGNIPDAILLDMILPDGSGGDFIENLKSKPATSSIPFHIISSMDKDTINGQGAVGISTKPISKEAIEYSLKNIQRLISDSTQFNILVIEDDKNTQNSIELLLRKKGVNVIPAFSSKQAFLLLDKEKVDCIILDLNLPDDENKNTLNRVTDYIKNNNSHLIIYTGEDLAHDEYKNLRQYTDDIIVKGEVSQARLLDDVTGFLSGVDRSGMHSSIPEDNNIEVIGSSEFNSKGDITNELEGVKVLVVDDDMRNTFALSGLLKRYGMEVIMADNGHLALEKLKERDGIKIVLMDIMMPVMDGYETIKKIRESEGSYSDLPIIALTAKAMPEDKEKCLNVGANDYLSKPVDSNRLVSAIKMWASS